MTLVDLTTELARQVQREGVAGRHFPLALRLVTRTWQARQLPDDSEQRWGLAVGEVLDVADLLFPQPADEDVLLDDDLGVSDEQARSAVSALLIVLADALVKASSDDDADVWAYAEAEAKLRIAAQDLL